MKNKPIKSIIFDNKPSALTHLHFLIETNKEYPVFDENDHSVLINLGDEFTWIPSVYVGIIYHEDVDAFAETKKFLIEKLKELGVKLRFRFKGNMRVIYPDGLSEAEEESLSGITRFILRRAFIGKSDWV